ncbi:hypothetical protein ABZ614_22070 [Streptomyces sp. NPDC013178]
MFSPSRDDLTEQIYSLKREVVEFRDATGRWSRSCSPHHGEG